MFFRSQKEDTQKVDDTSGIKTTIKETAIALLRLSATSLPHDVQQSMQEIKQEVLNHEGALLQISNILDDVELARETSAPMCQDTGIVSFILSVGDQFPLKSELKEILREATGEATKLVPLRPNTVDFFEGNPGNNIDPRGHIPYFYMDLVSGDKLKITAMTKGGGSSNIAKLGMLKPGLGLKGAMQFVIDALAEAGPAGCPPYRIGVGIGGGEDICMNLAKKALLRPLGERHADERVANLENSLMEACNVLPIGPMGVGAGQTVMDVNINLASRHPASLPVGVVFSCWALRHASAIISPDSSVEFVDY
ncbi:MAG: fumarate hydratase [Candidatus Kariarchaeaceae archaeon]|jgi:fumarate hydratase subunit alpha